jgi:hypothetical protein
MNRWLPRRHPCPIALLAAGLLCAGLAATPRANAQFAAAVTPPRFEVEVQPGDVTRQVIEITQSAGVAGNYRIYTTDWTIDDNNALTYYNTIQPGSCRPWVAIERRDLSIAAGARLRYRFEVAPPAQATPQECRFALMVESQPQNVTSGDIASFPMSGRIAVIVYVRVGNAKPVLEPGAATLGSANGRAVPLLSVSNRGNATGRLSGILKGVDAAGEAIEFSPDASPILPGQTRQIVLQPYEPAPRPPAPGSAAAAARPLRWPVRLSGVLEYGPNAAGKFAVEGTVAEPTAK